MKVQVYKVVSEELKYTYEDINIRTILHILPPKLWGKIEKVVRIRIENILLENVNLGSYDDSNKICTNGSLGTWIEADHLIQFENTNAWEYMIIQKIENARSDEKLYIENYFWNLLCIANYQDIGFLLKNYIQKGLINNNSNIVNKLESILRYEENHPWWKVFEEELKNFPEIVYDDFLPF